MRPREDIEDVTFTSFGSITADTARIPDSAKTNARFRERSFEETLAETRQADVQRVDDRRIGEDLAQTTETASTTSDADDLAAQASAGGDARPQQQDPAKSDQRGDTDDAPGHDLAGTQAAAAANHDDRDTSVGAPEEARRFASKSGKGHGAPTDPSSGSGADTRAAHPDAATTAGAATGGAAAAATSTGVAGVGATASGNVRVEGITNAAGTNAGQSGGSTRETATERAQRSEQPQAGYRSATKAALQLDAAARESVFRQIAMRLTPEGGQMRLVLDPAELGEVDVKLRVDGKTLHLTIVTERPELAASLESDLASLRDALRAQGLDVGQAEIHTREDAPEGRDPSGWAKELRDEFEAQTAARAGRDADANAAAESPRMHRHLITADRLDFWA